jgi:hypothetical protein
MTRRLSARLALPIAALALLSACVVNLSFEMHKSLPLQSQSDAAGTVSQTQLVDLSQYKEIQEHRSNIKSLGLDYADASIISINKNGTTATTVSGSLVLRADPNDTTHDVKVGDLQAFPVRLGATKRLNGTPELDAFLFQQLQGQGKFYVVITGTVDGKTDIVLDVTMHANIGYDAGL